MPTTAADLSGGCLCGAVRYRLAVAPHDAAWCHCRTCQLNSGSQAMAFATVPQNGFHFERGEKVLKIVSSSENGERAFCGECGTPLLMREKDGTGAWDFSLATLDDPGAVEPQFHIYFDSRIAWDQPGDAMPRYSRSRINGAESDG